MDQNPRWWIVEGAFIRPRNIKFDRHVFLLTKHLRGETVEHFYDKLKELAENCDFENKEETLIRDVFITNLIDPAIQKELKQTVELRQALELAINMELGMRNQHQIQQHSKTLIPASVNVIHFPNKPRSSNWSFSNNSRSRIDYHCIAQIVVGTGYPIIAINASRRGKTCNNCGLMNHFAKVCRKQKNAKLQTTKKRTVNIVDEEPQPEDSVNFLRSRKLYESY